MSDGRYMDTSENDEPHSSDFEEQGAFYAEEDSDDNDLSQLVELKRQKSYEVLDKEGLEARIKKLVREVMEVLGISNEASAILLLRHFKWNKEKFVDAYTADYEKTLEEAGVFPELEIEPKFKKKKVYECLVCCEDYSGKETYALGCGHRYCFSCWSGYLENQLHTGVHLAVNTKCPSPKCPAIVHEVAWKKLVPKHVYRRYASFALKSMVIDDPLLKPCPAPNCSKVIRVDFRDRTKPVECTCKFRWCFRCSDYDIGDHVPATCENVMAWNERASSESENIKWLIVNTKRCPECHRPIEKNGGCMHMTCSRKSGGCGYEFCWLCRGPWKEHGTDTGGYYSCNKYNSSTAKEEDIKNEEMKTELEYYMFYYHRYESHRIAMKVVSTQRERCDQQVAELVKKFSIRAQDALFLYDATQQILNNRRVLLWSYVYGFFLTPKDREKELYEFLQEDLEKFNEALTKLYEKPIQEITEYSEFLQWKSQVANKTRVTKNFLDKFVQGTARGLTSGN